MSQQNAQTPRIFLDAVEFKFGVKFVFDLACTTQDCVAGAGYYFDQGFDALAQDWSEIKVAQTEWPAPSPAGWLNPPWKKTGLFAQKCWQGTDTQVPVLTEPDTNLWLPGIRIFSLFPAGVGSQWFGNYVLDNCAVYFLNPRLTYLNPETGKPFISKKTGQPQTGLNDAMLCDWAPPDGPSVNWWQWIDPYDYREYLTEIIGNGTK